MIAKRIAAAGAAVVLIMLAVVIRDRVIEGDDGDADDSSTGSVSASELVCVAELAAVCRTVGADLGFDVTIADASTTEAAWTASDSRPDQLWLTFEPYPGIVDARRSSAGDEPIAAEIVAVASSPIALVVPVELAPTLEQACGTPIDWVCLGTHAGSPWTDLAPDAPSSQDVRPAFAPTSSAIGTLSVTSAISGWFGDAPIQASDARLIPWARQLGRAVAPTSLSAGTPIATIQVRPSLLDVAVGAEAELAASNRDRFSVLYADPMLQADIVLVVPAGSHHPDSLAERLRDELVIAGWGTPGSGPGSAPGAATAIAARAVWDEVT